MTDVAQGHEMGELEETGDGWRAACSCGWRSEALADVGEVRFAWEQHSGQVVNG